MKSVKSILLIAALFCSLLVANLVVAETGIETDPEDDVIVSETVQNDEGSETQQSTTSEMPGADIIEVSYERLDGDTELNVFFKVNEAGEVEETVDIDNLENDSEFSDLFSKPKPLAYIILVITDQKEYTVEYTFGNCTLNYGTPIDYSIDGNKFSATFDLESSNETITSISAQSMFISFEMLGLTAFKTTLYMDAAPDSSLFTAIIDAPTEATTSDEIQFSGSAQNLADLFGMGVTETNYIYEWDFDDGSSGSGESVTHSYQYPGSYTVELTVTDSEGTETSTTTTVTVSEGSTSNGDTSDNDGDGDSGDGTESDNTIMIFIAIIGIIVVIGVVALVVVIRR
jgi:PKD repeat protein